MNTAASPTSGRCSAHLRAERKGQGQIPADLFAILLFFVIIIVFFMLFSIERVQRQNNLQANFAIAQTHRTLLGFIKSDSQGTPITAMLLDATPPPDNDQAAKNSYEQKQQVIRKTFTDEFNAVYGDNWFLTIQYPASYGSLSISPVNNNYKVQAGTGFVQHLISSIITGPTAVPLILSEPVSVTQRVPTPDGDSIVITLQTWVVY